MTEGGDQVADRKSRFLFCADQHNSSCRAPILKILDVLESYEPPLSPKYRFYGGTGKSLAPGGHQKKWRIFFQNCRWGWPQGTSISPRITFSRQVSEKQKILMVEFFTIGLAILLQLVVQNFCYISAIFCYFLLFLLFSAILEIKKLYFYSHNNPRISFEINMPAREEYGFGRRSRENSFSPISEIPDVGRQWCWLK